MNSLPFFKFYSEAWLTGEITLLPLDTQGLFVNLCALLWKKENILPYKPTLIAKRLRITEEKFMSLLKELTDAGLVDVNDTSITIKFIGSQFKTLTALHEKKVSAGKKGAEARYKKEKTPPAPPAPPKKKAKRFVPPTEKEVAQFCKEKGYLHITPKDFIEYYAVNDWKDAYNNPVKNWKQKLIAVWGKKINSKIEKQAQNNEDFDDAVNFLLNNEREA